MESWSYVSGGKGFISNEANSSSGDFAGRKMPWWAGDSKAPCSFGNNMLVSGQEAINDQPLGEVGFEGKQLHESSIIRNVFSSKVVDDEKIFSHFARSPPSFCLDESTTSRISSSIVDSYSRESPLIGLKLGSLGDPIDGQISRIYNGAPVASSSNSSVQQKRTRIGENSHTTYCQVYGCNEDLSSSKEYHKRHKVCEAHSKTAKVIVNGIEQRFCQQCSRFHLLSEFDDVKRSCRRRLAGHNERRRKPQVGFHSGRTRRHAQSYNGTSAGFGCASTAPSFICPDILPNGVLHHEKYRANDWYRRIKVEEEARFSPVPIFPISSGNLPSKLLFPSSNFDKIFPPTCNEDGANHTASVFRENTNCYLDNMGALGSGSRSLLQDTSLENDNFPDFDAASTIQGFSGIAESDCALSLLSSQSHNSSCHSSGIPIARPLVPGRDAHYGMTQVSEKLMGVNSQASTSGVSNKFSSPGISSAEGSHLSPILISVSSEPINFDIADGPYQGSDFVNAKDQLCCEDGATINLLQLSTQLQRVECEKQSIEVKQENGAFCCPSIT